ATREAHGAALLARRGSRRPRGDRHRGRERRRARGDRRAAGRPRRSGLACARGAAGDRPRGHERSARRGDERALRAHPEGARRAGAGGHVAVTRTLRAMPTLMRVGFAEAMAYRAELLVWVLTTTMPLVMLPLWMAVAETGPVRGFTGDDFV